MLNPISKEQSDAILAAIGIENEDCEVIFHHKVDPAYLKAAYSRLWDTPREWVVIRMDDADDGLCIYARYGEPGDTRWVNPWSTRHLVRVFLSMLGHELPMPIARERDR